MNKSLGEIVAEKKELDKILDESNGEISDNLEVFLDINTGELAIKIDNCHAWLEQLETRLASMEGVQKFYKEKIEAVSNKIKAQENLIHKFLDYMAYNMKNCGAQVIEGNVSRFAFRKSQKRLVLEGEIPPKYMIEKVTLSEDKTAIRDALESGLKVGDCRLEGGEYLHYSIKTKK